MNCLDVIQAAKKAAIDDNEKCIVYEVVTRWYQRNYYGYIQASEYDWFVDDVVGDNGGAVVKLLTIYPDGRVM